MIQELLYTSAPKGLKPGSRGFCTVLSTSGMPAPVATALESLSGYRPIFPPGDPQADQNPVVYSHYQMSLNGRRSHVLSRIADYGLDYSQRSNKLAHHLVLEPSERPSAGPAWVLAHSGMMRESWDGELKIISGERKVPDGPVSLRPCNAWKELAGDAGWAGVLAETFLKQPDQPAFIIFSPGMNLLPLMEEAISLLPANRRWDATFSTYFTKVPSGVTCNWRCLLADSPEAKESRRYVHALRIDLTKPLPPATGGELVEVARTGRRPAPSVANPSPQSHPAEINADSSETYSIAGGQSPPSLGKGRYPLPPAGKRISPYPVGYGDDGSGSSSGSWMKWIVSIVVLALIGSGTIALMKTKKLPEPKSEKVASPAPPEPPVAAEPPPPEPVPELKKITVQLDREELPENEPPGTPVGTFSFSPQMPESPVPNLVLITGQDDFEVRNEDGVYKLYAKRSFDYEDQRLADRHHVIKLETKVSGEWVKEGTQTFEIQITDVPEKPTKIELSGSKISAGAPDETTIGVLSSEGPDSGDIEGDAFMYEVVEGMDLFKVEEVKGKWELKKTKKDFPSEKSSVSVKIKSLKKQNPELFLVQEFEIEVQRPVYSQHHWIPLGKQKSENENLPTSGGSKTPGFGDLLTGTTHFEIPQNLPGDFDQIKIWIPTSETNFKSEDGRVWMSITSGMNEDWEECLVAEITRNPDRQPKLSLQAKPAISYSDLGRFVVSVESRSRDRCDIFLHGKGKKDGTGNSVRIPIVWPQRFDKWKLRLDTLVFSTSKKNLAKTGSLDFNPGERHLSYEMKVKCVDILDREWLDREWPKESLSDASKEIWNTDVNLEVRVTGATSDQGQFSLVEAQVIVDQNDFEKSLKEHIKGEIDKAVLAQPSGVAAPTQRQVENLNVATKEFAEEADRWYESVQKYRQNEETARNKIVHPPKDPDEEKRRKQHDDNVKSANDQLKRLSSIIEYCKIAQAVSSKLREAKLEEIQISQKCTNRKEEKYMPIIVYRQLDRVK
jgi:hypothetical protein